MAFVKRGHAARSLLDTYSIERVPHVRSVVAHAADMGRLIDQLAGRESHGIDHNAGYGGTRPAPRIEAGMIHGDDPRVGHVSRLARGEHGIPANCFVVISATDQQLPPEASTLGAVQLTHPDLLDGAFAMIVRPDDYIAAIVGDDAELNVVFDELSSWLG